MRVAALDLATTSGFAFAVDGGAPIYGSVRLGKAGSKMGEVFVAFDAWLNARIDEWHPDVIIFEAPIFLGRGSVAVVQRLMGLAAITELVGLKRGLRVFQAEGSSVTKSFTGRGGRFPGGKAEKKALVMETCRRYGWAPETHDAADALALLHYSQSILNRQSLVSRAAGPLFAS